MSTITIPIAEEDLKFLQAWTSEQGTTVEEFLAKEARNLRQHLATPLHPDISQAIGVISGAVDARKEHLDYLAKKHA